jgi:hypothetical protein
MILKEPTVVIVDGAVRNIDLLGVSVLDTRDRLVSPDASFFAVWHNNKWMAGKSMPFRVVGLSTIGNPANHFILLGENGEISILGGGRDDTEQIAKDIDLPLTNIVSMGSHIYVVGMGRQVYVREGENKWIPIHSGILSKEPEKIIGFQTIVQIDNYLYTGGWSGEIWYYNGVKWSQEDSPTNFILSASALTQDGKIVFCGRNGTIVVGETGAWRIVNTDSISDDLWSVVNYENKLFFSSQSHIYCLDGEELNEVPLDIEGYKGTHYKLRVVGHYLFSFGEHDILVFDGKEWSRVLTE